MTRELWYVLGAGVLINAGLLFEVIGLTVKGQHSISWYAYDFWPLRAVILLAILVSALLWWFHSGQAAAR